MSFDALRDMMDVADSLRPPPGAPDRIRITSVIPPGLFVLTPYEHDGSVPSLGRTVSADGPHEILAHPEDWEKISQDARGWADPEGTGKPIGWFFGLPVIYPEPPNNQTGGES